MSLQSHLINQRVGEGVMGSQRVSEVRLVPMRPKGGRAEGIPETKRWGNRLVRVGRHATKNEVWTYITSLQLNGVLGG